MEKRKASCGGERTNRLSDREGLGRARTESAVGKEGP